HGLVTRIIIIELCAPFFALDDRPIRLEGVSARRLDGQSVVDDLFERVEGALLPHRKLLLLGLFPFGLDRGRDDDAGRHQVAVVVEAELDAFELAAHRRSRLAVLHELDRRRDDAFLVAVDGDLSVVGPGETGMAARTATGDAAMVDDDDEAIESHADGISGADELR